MLPLAIHLSEFPPRKKLAVELLKMMLPTSIGLAMSLASGVASEPVLVAPVKTRVVVVALVGAVPAQLAGVLQLTLAPLPDQVKVAADAKEDALRTAALMMILRLQRRAEPVCFSRRETNDFSHSINRIECLKRLDALTKHPRHSMNAA